MVIQLLTAKGLLQDVTKTRALTELEFQLEFKKLEMQREQRKAQESTKETEGREIQEKRERRHLELQKVGR